MLLDLDEGTLSIEKVGGGILDLYCWVIIHQVESGFSQDLG